MTDTDTEHVQRALDTAVARGAGYADVRVVDLVVEGLVVKNGAVEALTRRESRGIGVRALVDGAWGFAGTADLAAASPPRPSPRPSPSRAPAPPCPAAAPTSGRP